MKILLIVIPVIILIVIYLVLNRKPVITNTKRSLYDFVVKDIKGHDFKFSDLKGKKIMIVNTASKCGLTPQYEQLQEIYTKYSETNNFIIIGFPADNFLYQEPGKNKEIEQFCKLNYGVTFPMMEKIDVKGVKQAEIYQFLTLKKFNEYKDSSVKWNFQKYLIGRNGKLERIINPKTKPNDPSIIAWITK